MANSRKIRTRKKHSQGIFKDLNEHSLIPRYPNQQTKKKGVMPGVILLGKNKHGVGKTVYVKYYSNKDVNGLSMDTARFDALGDYAAFVILRECGARVPKVRLKGTQKFFKAHDKHQPLQVKNKIYLFSTDLAQQKSKHPDKKYWYGDMECKSYSINMNTLQLDASISLKDETDDASADGGVTKAQPVYHYPIDLPSAARLLILGLILQLGDLHINNMGYVLSRHGDKVTAKLTFIDFFVTAKHISLLGAHSLRELVCNYYGGYFQPEELARVIASLTEQDYMNALHDIESNFDRGCKLVTTQIEQMPFVTNERKEQFNAKLVKIKYNLTQLQEFQAKKSLSCYK
jgi:hypothetical protein